MLRIDFSSAIAFYLCFSLILVFGLWVFYNYRKNGQLNGTKHLRQCPFCTYMFFHYGSSPEEESPDQPVAGEPDGDNAAGKTKAVICPRCKSYIDV